MVQQLEQTHARNLGEGEKQLRRVRKALDDHHKAANARISNDKQKLAELPSIKDLSSAVCKRKKLLAQVDSLARQYGVNKTEHKR